MKLQFIVGFLMLLTLMTACGVQPTAAIDPTTPAQPSSEVQGSDDSINGAVPMAETASASCLGSEISPLGQSIADDYDAVSYEQVMTWFCNGAEFEDILVALETAAQTDTTVDEMLQMLADDLTWEDIWWLVGLTD